METKGSHITHNCLLYAVAVTKLKEKMAKRKYIRWGEEAKRYECTKKKCKWQGRDEEMAHKRINEYQTDHVCPKCGNNEFWGLLE